MKAYLLLIALTALFCGACRHPAKPHKKGYLLKKGYVLSIDQDSIGQARDSTLDGKQYKFFWVAAEVSNFSSDTLKYMTMSCSWDVIFTFNKKTAFITRWNCDSNFPTLSAIAPQKSFTYKIPLLVEKNAIISNYTFKIGMYLFKCHKQRGFREFDNFLDSKFGISPHSNKTVYKNIIWSNEATIPKP
jgi:hypothetical protein